MAFDQSALRMASGGSMRGSSGWLMSKLYDVSEVFWRRCHVPRAHLSVECVDGDDPVGRAGPGTSATRPPGDRGIAFQEPGSTAGHGGGLVSLRDRGVGGMVEWRAPPLRLRRRPTGRFQGGLPSAPTSDHRGRLKPNRQRLHQTQGGSPTRACQLSSTATGANLRESGPRPSGWSRRRTTRSGRYGRCRGTGTSAR
jgi:hypothetical protein